MKIHYIYKITNLINGKIYVGRRSSISPPEEDHYFGSGGRSYQCAISVDGKENFKKEIIEVCSDFDTLCEREEHYISILNATDPNVDKTDLFECDVCNELFRTENKLREHIKINHKP